ncbi:hypothetical protein LTR97_003553 [Elasticomyces elasticus]|uniref:BTB domain-containing protein n=1 Tax=Elasticomyces elasticus TaxID=574655 RepID=A0AAN7W875_9PEZI|nr:hypothetical protein LTR97_003553 [Elasticomyces elasticus]
MDDTFLQSLQSRRDLEIIVGSLEPQSFYVQQHLFESTTGCSIEAFGTGAKLEPGVLRFPDNDLISLQLLLRWMYHRVVPSGAFDQEVDISSAMRTWGLGERLDVPDFQNQIMLCILRWLNEYSIDPELIKNVVRSSHINSPMRTLMVIETAWQIQNHNFEPEVLEELDGHGFLLQVMRVMRDGFECSPDYGVSRERIDYAIANKYMLRGGLLGQGFSQ